MRGHNLLSQLLLMEAVAVFLFVSLMQWLFKD